MTAHHSQCCGIHCRREFETQSTCGNRWVDSRKCHCTAEIARLVIKALSPAAGVGVACLVGIALCIFARKRYQRTASKALRVSSRQHHVLWVLNDLANPIIECSVHADASDGFVTCESALLHTTTCEKKMVLVT